MARGGAGACRGSVDASLIEFFVIASLLSVASDYEAKLVLPLIGVD
jgi:hypothetical protein